MAFFSAVLAFVAADSLPAAVISVTQGTLAQTKAAEAVFLAGKRGIITETFEGFSVGNGKGTGLYSDPIQTAVGTFTQITQGGGGACLQCDKLAILDGDTTPFAGRFNVTDGGKNWLDSNDSSVMQLDFGILAPVYNFGFFLTDPNDAGGRLRISFNNGDIDDVTFGGALNNARLYYIAYEGAKGPVNSLKFTVNRPTQGLEGSDGFGIDNFSLAEAPEPGTYLMLAGGLVGLFCLRRRK
jgi:hypothetical protein